MIGEEEEERNGGGFAGDVFVLKNGQRKRGLKNSHKFSRVFFVRGSHPRIKQKNS